MLGIGSLFVQGNDGSNGVLLVKRAFGAGATLCAAPAVGTHSFYGGRFTFELDFT
jgi:hypothetical protein